MLRNPLEVGKNAQDAEQSSHSLAEAIWIRRALDAEYFSRSTPRYFASFERLCQSWDLVVQDAQEALQLAWPKPPATVEANIEELLAGLTFSKDLQARAMTSTLLPPWIRESYKILNGWALSEEMPAHHVLLDTLRGDFDVAADAFGRVVRAERHAQTKYAEAQRLRMQAELDALSRAAAANEAERASFAVERDAWESEKDKYRTERDDLIRERDALAAERQRLIAEQEVRRAERETLIAKRDGVMAERDRLAAERESGRARYDGLVTERDALVTQYDILAAERGALAAERDTLVAERDALVADRDGIAAERDTLASGRNLLLAEREEWATDRDALRERLSNQQATHDQQSAALKVSLQEQRRTTTLLNAQVQDLKERCDDLQSELDDARAEVAATRARRKEMARVIANRDRQLSARYDELARLQQLALRFDPVWRIRRAFGWLKRRLRGAKVSGQPR
jgi:hypothetical protein